MTALEKRSIKNFQWRERERELILLKWFNGIYSNNLIEFIRIISWNCTFYRIMLFLSTNTLFNHTQPNIAFSKALIALQNCKLLKMNSRYSATIFDIHIYVYIWGQIRLFLEICFSHISAFLIFVFNMRSPFRRVSRAPFPPASSRFSDNLNVRPSRILAM